MKLKKILCSLLILIAGTGIYYFNNSALLSSSLFVVEPSKKCSCGPIEHWFYKCCVNYYKQQYPQAELVENNDTEGLPENIVQAVAMLARDMAFVDAQGIEFGLELNVKGNLYLPMMKNQDYSLSKNILRNVDITTHLTAEELYKAWIEQLVALKSA